MRPPRARREGKIGMQAGDRHDDGPGRRITGRHVLFGMLAFFGVVFAANGIMMWMAARTFDGLDEPDAYRRGVHYNERLAAARAQRALGWRMELSLAASGVDGLDRSLRVNAQRADGRPLDGLAIRVTMRSPVNAREDREVTLAADPTAPGLYGAGIRLPRLGKWQAVVEAEDAAGHRWRGVFDLFLAPDAAAKGSGR